jgi:hypothetical protein
MSKHCTAGLYLAIFYLSMIIELSGSGAYNYFKNPGIKD